MFVLVRFIFRHISLLSLGGVILFIIIAGSGDAWSLIFASKASTTAVTLILTIAFGLDAFSSIVMREDLAKEINAIRSDQSEGWQEVATVLLSNSGSSFQYYVDALVNDPENSHHQLGFKSQMRIFTIACDALNRLGFPHASVRIYKAISDRVNSAAVKVPGQKKKAWENATSRELGAVYETTPKHPERYEGYKPEN